MPLKISCGQSTHSPCQVHVSWPSLYPGAGTRNGVSGNLLLPLCQKIRALREGQVLARRAVHCSEVHTFTRWSSTSMTVATRMSLGFLLSTASSLMLGRKPWGVRWNVRRVKSAKLNCSDTHVF